MSKKKKEVTPVVLSYQELMPSVLGRIDSKEKSNWVVIVLFIVLIVFIIALPTITSYIKGEKQITFTPDNSDQKKPTDNTPGHETIYYDYSDTLEIPIGGLNFKNFDIVRKDFSLMIENENEVKNYLVTHALYMELYDEEQTLLQRIKLPNENLSKGNTMDFHFELNVPTSSIAKIVIEEKKVSDYPAIQLNKETDGTYMLVCSKSEETITYQFDTSGKLYYIMDIVNYSSSKEDYQMKLMDYRQMSSKYNGLDGVTSNISEVGTGFTSTTTLSLEKIDFENKNVKNTLDNPAYYGKDTEGKVVYFELSAMNYQCS
ncbi:MAG: hypothetical protein HFI09_01070 [Bacilli bacterium]|nr:hypothetical protein [Bacilli bacterium]